MKNSLSSIAGNSEFQRRIVWVRLRKEPSIHFGPARDHQGHHERGRLRGPGRGAQFERATEGVWDLAKDPPDAFNPGDVAKVAAGINIIDAAGTLRIGWVVATAVAGSTTVRVKLTPCVASPPMVFEAPGDQGRHGP